MLALQTPPLLLWIFVPLPISIGTQLTAREVAGD
jgi:hypothetical protein